MRNDHWCKRNSLDGCLKRKTLYIVKGVLYKNKQSIRIKHLSHDGATILAGGYYWHQECLNDWQKKFIAALKEGKGFYFRRNAYGNIS